MHYNGRSDVTLSWGHPRSRPFKGFMVRWLEWLNSTWPHASHRLVNSGRDAQPLSRLQPCLFAYVPNDVDVVFLEVASMYMYFDPVPIEAVVRQLSELRPRPAIVFITIALWCKCTPLCRNTPAYGVSDLPPKIEQHLLWSVDGLQDSMDVSLAALCRRYDATCLSMRRALNDSVYAHAAGFSIPEVAQDCLHPIHGSRGVDYVTDVLVHWTRAAANARLPMPNHTSKLPRPVHRYARYAPLLAKQPAVCFSLGVLGSRGVSNGNRLLTVS